MTNRRVRALVTARNEADRIAATVSALRSLPQVAHVVVMDDASTDGTASQALTAGATVLQGRRRAGKGRAVDSALLRLPPAGVWLLADADLGHTAARLGPILSEVLEGRADLAVAVLPPARSGGFGLVKRSARRAIRLLSGFQAVEPLSGQRAITQEALQACRPLSAGFGLETGMTIDAVRRGFRVVEIPADLDHRATGRGIAGFAHRGRQGIDILFAVLPRALGFR
ncbi:MAG TPA: glycosyltransferase [Methylomirabilota bacterium]|nr:glycosyltransferase [Methylomirabilota bacterium]HYU92720.1 glycosyltransferase [Actinomycetota bacterium]